MDFLKSLRKIYKSRHTGKNFLKFEAMCDEVAHSQTPASPMETPLTPKQASILIEKNKKLKMRVCRQRKTITLLKEEVKRLTLKLKRKVKKTKKSTHLTSRKMHYACLLSGVAAKNVPKLLQNFVMILQEPTFCINSDTTVYRMQTELGFFSDLKSVEYILRSESCSLLFDSTTQDGIHVNCVMFTTPSSSHLVSIERLPGGTAEDYRSHINTAIKTMAEVYSLSSGLNADSCRKSIISKIKCCLIDRAPVNHLTVFLLEKEWDTHLIELNCNVHPLEAVSSRVKKELQACEEVQTTCSGECIAWKIIMALNSLRFSDKYKHVVPMRNFMRKAGVQIPRFLGNRLHVIFQLGVVYFSIFPKLLLFVRGLIKKNKVVEKLKVLITVEAAVVELQVLGILAKMLSGPWMHKFYTDLTSTANPIKTMQTVRGVIAELKKMEDEPKQILLAERDFFGDVLPQADKERLMVAPQNPELFQKMMTACVKGTIEVLERQYKKSFVTVETSTESVLLSVRQHTMEVESVIGEYCERKKGCPNAYVSSISNIIKAKRNKVWSYIHGLDDGTLQRTLDVAIHYSRDANKMRFTRQEKLEAEIIKRSEEKQRQHQKKERCQLQKRLKGVQHTNSAIKAEFPDFSQDFVDDICKILRGDIVGHTIKHIWTVKSVDKIFVGWVMEFSDPDYNVFYEDYQLDKCEMATDYIMHDLLFNG